ncbi:flagellar hook-basal body complex protein [Clostridium tyrobutyricum]|jgi:flagellar hook protein FlgE|uniref:Flagellar hook protein FlgE n=1 Tax=Clostridium tyrobutyricum DIVETGP TaxID=1408889 RepID=W6N5L5_CLOTY|nr:flagellar hook-basal body complex protein [Clostridium tyrobutyricum]AND85277.1 flagellar hook protein FlgE [Clostridium tyrobutyricum]ANP69833.1 flagellar biosynthesis protein FlgE [Clostridium tyrobutyricum]MBV4420950.1 flagellar hook-basal body complex protein [Clostridium tyrobutyricum]MBV4424059.1 flagellar hook-basal body complex protein [Clostridium tyrobutyricum]MBV4434342.1 flagellar hook-basal body complex protein [Clostridium tyrobutyricum]
MLPSLYSGISGLRANQQKLNVVANNIANSSTTGFKTQSMNFEDMISQNLSDPSAPVNNGIGGVNGKQSGLGVKVGGISTDFTNGSMQSTNRNLDFALDGTGYFVVSPDGGTDDYYTRDGAFVLDKDGNLLTQEGNHVMGYASGATGTGQPTTALSIKQYYTSATNGVDTGTDAQKVSSFSVGKDGSITVKLGDGTSYEVGQIGLASFQNEGGLVKMGGNLYKTSPNSGDATYGTSGSGSFGDINQGMLEMSNVDLAQQFTDMIIAQRAFQANGKIISTDDEVLQDLVNLKR